MRPNYKEANARVDRRPGCFLMPFILVFLIGTCFFNKANAQRGNQSDWNVPPPVAPGTITKGDATGSAGNSGAVALPFADVPAGVQPVAAVSVLQLAPISATPPDASQPQQPETADILVAFSGIPLPEMPEMPNMPDRSLQDMPEPISGNMPMPLAPDMPPIPPEPVGSVAPNTRDTGLPLIPKVSLPVTFSGPPIGTVLWSTPGVPQTIDFKLIITPN
nr:hypothetical protein [uncultured Mucilaginibacter sp.]